MIDSSGTLGFLVALHDLGVARRRGRRQARARPDGSPRPRPGAARVAATENQLTTDRVQPLALTSLAVGSDRAAASASGVIGDDGVADVLPFLQPAAFDLDIRKAIREEEWNLKDLGIESKIER